MIKPILMWLCLTVGIAIGIMQVRHMTGEEIWSITKLMMYSAMCSALAILVLVAIVILF